MVTKPLGPTLFMFGVDFVDYGCFTSQVSHLPVEGNFNPPPVGYSLPFLIKFPNLFGYVLIVRYDLQTLPPPSIIEF